MQTVKSTDPALPRSAEHRSRNGGAVPDDDVFRGDHHVYEPFKVGLPPLRPYVREVWNRRQFALQLSKTKLRAKHYDTALGQLWMVLTPLLMACVYFLLVMVIRGGSRGIDFFAHLCAALFAFHLFSQSVQQASTSIVRGGKLVLNTAFPRVLLPLSSVVHAFRRFLPTVLIYAVIHTVVGVVLGWEILLTIPLLGLILLMAAGVSCLAAALQVYFRDLSNFLPHLLRIWLYTTPILYTAEQASDRGLSVVMWLNPMAPIIRAWSSVIDEAKLPPAEVFAAGIAWAVGLFLVGILFFMSRERELVVRL
ncbi:MAG TPA: ABC transporter permease [Thermoleophilaceae bacterium]|nr:ABC transporter permease [Thermoleophilaceae bacterium]